MSDLTKDDRPIYRNLALSQITTTYRLPPAGIVSILHRASGAILFLLLPLVLYLLNRSLTSVSTFAYIRGVTDHLLVKLVLIVLVWAYLQHFCAGIRHLFMDVHMGLTKGTTNKTALGVIITSLVLTALVALKLFGAF